MDMWIFSCQRTTALTNTACGAASALTMISRFNWSGQGWMSHTGAVENCLGLVLGCPKFLEEWARGIPPLRLRSGQAPAQRTRKDGATFFVVAHR